MTQFTLTLTEAQHQMLRDHLFPGDGLEAVALLLCGRRASHERQRLMAHKIVLVPHAKCTRAPDRVTWPTDALPPLLNEAAQKNFALVKIHGHTSYQSFSAIDDISDRALFPSVHAWTVGGAAHGSAVMMADGHIFARACAEDGTFTHFERVTVVGDDIRIWSGQDEVVVDVPEAGRRIVQLFGKGTFARLRRMKFGVVGCSGTGSPVIEMLARNSAGALVLVDPDKVEEKNLNRILNARMEDARIGRLKVDVAAEAISVMGLNVAVTTFAKSLFHRDVVEALSGCDVLFGCMDSIDGRHLLNKLATFYSIPYFDLGVKIVADGLGGVDQVCGSVHYLRPGGSSLLSRGVYTMEQVRAQGLARTDPATYVRNKAEGYIQGVPEDRPAVIQLNMLIASMAVNEMLARLHPYRLEPNGKFAVNRVSLSHAISSHEDDGTPCALLARHVGRGDSEPPLDWPELTR